MNSQLLSVQCTAIHSVSGGVVNTEVSPSILQAIGNGKGRPVKRLIDLKQGVWM